MTWGPRCPSQAPPLVAEAVMPPTEILLTNRLPGTERSCLRPALLLYIISRLVQSSSSIWSTLARNSVDAALLLMSQKQSTQTSQITGMHTVQQMQIIWFYDMQLHLLLWSSPSSIYSATAETEYQEFLSLLFKNTEKSAFSPVIYYCIFFFTCLPKYN